MKELLAIWIFWQLITIGLTGARIHNKVVDKTYQCLGSDEKVSVISSVVLPLAWFVSEPEQVKKYCENQLTRHP